MRVNPFIPHRARLFAATALLAGLAACGERPASYFPLDPDRYWQYTVERTTMDGPRVQKYIIETRPSQQWDGHTVYVRQTVDGSRFFYSDEPAGVMRIARKLRSDDAVTRTEPAILVLPRSPVPGETWRQPTYTAVLENTGPPWETLFRITQPVELEYTVESVTDTIRVGAGSFANCLRIVGEGNTNTDVGNYIGHAEISVHVTEWFAPGVGLVRSERIETTDADALNHGSIVMELESYE